jgi:hypothetical protein
MIRHVLVALLLAGSGPLQAQLTGHVDVTALGFAFDIPAGWQGAEQEGTWGLVSGEVPGTIILTTHEHTGLQELERDMRNVASEDPANQLSVVGPASHPLPHAVMLDFSGTMEWQPVRLRGIGSISDAGGPGTSIIALAQGTELPPALSDAALSVMRSMRYSKPVIPAVVEQWRTHLASTRLTYFASYSSSAATEGSLGGGMSSTRTLDLCPGGWYTLSYGADLVMGGSDVSSASNAKGTENGSWDVFTDAAAGARLELRANDGTIRSYGLSDRQGGTYLNGERWFRTTPADGENAPQCAP